MSEEELINYWMNSLTEDESWQSESDAFRHADLRWAYERLRVQAQEDATKMRVQYSLIRHKLKCQ